MVSYYKTNQVNIKDFSSKSIEKYYNDGYVFTRIDKGVMNQTRSLRVNMDEFELTSENKRILKHTEALDMIASDLPLDEGSYSWEIPKLAKNFYDKKFQKKIFSSNKMKELLTIPEKSNFNLLLSYNQAEKQVGYCVCFKTEEILHYAYPFYDFENFSNNYGMSMMIRAINYSIKLKQKYTYLGSVTRKQDKYKLQFKGLEWFNGISWESDLKKLKELLASDKK